MANGKKFFLLLFILFSSAGFARGSDNPLLEKGWAALVKDNDDDAFRYFFQAYEKANKENNTADRAESLLFLGMCSFGSSLEKGLQYATQSLGEFRKLEKSSPQQAKIGRSKCLQLISTIYVRQKKYDRAKKMSKEVVHVLAAANDDSGTLGLAFSSLGSLYEMDRKVDSANIYFQSAMLDFKKHDNYAYLPNAYIKIGEMLQMKRQRENSRVYFEKAFALADSTKNRQAQVSALLSLGKWHLVFEKNIQQAVLYFENARLIAGSLSDKMFEIKTLNELISVKKQQANFEEVSQLQNQLIALKDNFYSLEREQIVKSLEVQFEVSEKDRRLVLVSKEKEVSRLTNYLLAGFIAVLIVIFIFGYFFLKSINRRDRQLLRTKEALVDALEKQKEMQETQFSNDIEHKESQLSAITLQMLQKNELIEEIKATIEKKEPLSEQWMLKMVNKHFTQNNSWSDFDLYFESINRNFYTRLKQTYPEISANDLKICALIKLNLSIKEMASILNISPDSVKTARYRLRKKLQLNNEENLTEFILSV